MLDVETKNRINTARDILVGKVPDPKSQVEQITIALIYKFMDDMDVEAEELGGKRTFFVGEYAKYAWRKIFDPRQSGYELLNLYSEAITKMDTNPGVPKLFRDIFKNAYLPYRDPETLKSFLKIINDFEYSHSEKLGDAFEFLLSILGSQGDAGQFRTPRHIIDFMVAIIDPKKHEVILDPACGTAGFLISSYKHIVKHNSSNFLPEQNKGITVNGTQSVNELIITTNGYSGDKLTADERRILADNIHGYDISPDMVRLSLVNMYLHGIKEPHISEYDTLTSEDHWNQFCDVILANPPFMSPKGGIRPHKRFSVQSNRSEVLFVNYIAEHLTPGGRAAVIVPEGIIFQSGTAYKNLRKMLVEKYLVGVISLPAGVFQPYSGVKTSILWLDKVLAKKTDKILFVKIENDGFDLGAQRRSIKQNDIPGCLEKVNSLQLFLQQGKSFDIESNNDLLLIEKTAISRNDEYNLSGDRYITKTEILSNYPVVTLGDVIHGKPEYGSGAKKIDFDGSVRYLRITDIDDYGILKEEEIVSPSIIEKEYFLKKNDFLLARSGSVGRAYIHKNLSITCQFAGYLIRFKLNRDLISPPYMFYLTKSKRYFNWIESMKKDGTISNINAKEYCSFAFPLPPLQKQEEIVSEIESYQKIIDGARMVVENYKPRIEIDPEWEMVELREICKIMTGGTPSKNNPDFWKGNIPWVSPKDMKRDYISDTVDHVSDVAIRESSTKIVPSGTILCVVRSGILQHTFPIAITKTEVCYNQDLISIQCNPSKIDVLYLFHYLKTQSSFILENGIKSGVTVQSFRSGFFSKLLIPLPTLKIQKEIARSLSKEIEMIEINKELMTIYENRIKDRIAKVWGE